MAQHRDNDAPSDTGALSVISAHCGKSTTQKNCTIEHLSPYGQDFLLEEEINYCQFENS